MSNSGARFSLLPNPAAMALLALMLVLPLLGILSLKIDNAFDVWLPSDAEQVVFDNHLRENFPRDQVLVALFDGDDLFSDDFLTRLHQVVRGVEKHEFVERVLTVTNIDQIRGTDDGFVVEPLLSPEVARELDLDARRKRVLEDRFAPGLLVAEDGKTMALVVRPTALEDSFDRWTLQGALESEVAKAGLEDRLDGLTGNVALDVEQLIAALRDTATFVPATTGLGLLLIWWMFRRLLAVVLGALAMSAVSMSTVALLALADRPFTLISATIAPLMSALTVALLVHLYNGLAHASRRGDQGRARIDSALAVIRGPARYTAATTAAGLASLAVSQIQPIRSFGLCSAVGAIFVYFVVIVLLPPLLLKWDRGTWDHTSQFGRWVDRAIGALSRLGIRYAGWVIALALAALVIGGPQLWRVQAESDMYEFFPERHVLTVATEKAGDRLTGVNGMQVVFDGPGRDSLLEPARLAFITEFQRWLESLDTVDRTASMAEVIEEMHWAFNEEAPAFRALPADGDLINQYVFVYDGTDLFDLVNRDYSRTLVPINLSVRGANATKDTIEQIRNYLDGADLHGMRYEIAGFGRLFSDQVDLLIDGQVYGLWIAFSVIFLFMLLQWRSFGDSALCMVPNAAPIILIFVIMGTFGIWLDMATALIASVTAGVAVDDTIHVFHGYRSRRRSGASVSAALMRTYRHAGRAVVVTTTILACQFLMLMTSVFIPTVQFGMLTAVGLVAALLFDLLLLPAIIVVIAKLTRSETF